MGLTRPRLGQFQTTTTAFDDEMIKVVGVR